MVDKIEDELRKKIESSNLFAVLATKNYLECIRNLDGDIIEQIRIAGELEKPFFLIMDKNLNTAEKNEIRNYLSKYNIIKEIEFDKRDKRTLNNVAKEINKLIGKGAEIVEHRQLKKLNNYELEKLNNCELEKLNNCELEKLNKN